MTYKGHEIRKTETIHANTGRPLYAVVGRYSKDAAKRPFLLSRQQCRDWINEQIVANEMVQALPA